MTHQADERAGSGFGPEERGDALARAADDRALAADDHGPLEQGGVLLEKVDHRARLADVVRGIEAELLEQRVLAHEILDRILDDRDQVLERGSIRALGLLRVLDRAKRHSGFHGDRRGIDGGASTGVVEDRDGGLGHGDRVYANPGA